MDFSEISPANPSIFLLGTQVTHDTLVSDMYDLIDKAEEEKLTPIYVRLGPLFLDIGVCSSMRAENNVSDDKWSSYVEKFRTEISSAYQEYKLEIVKNIDNSTNGRDEKLFDKIPSKIKFYYDPDEAYISLVTCSKKKAKVGEPSTKSGHLIVTLRLHQKEVLSHCYEVLHNQ